MQGLLSWLISLVSIFLISCSLWMVPQEEVVGSPVARELIRMVELKLGNKDQVFLEKDPQVIEILRYGKPTSICIRQGLAFKGLALFDLIIIKNGRISATRISSIKFLFKGGTSTNTHEDIKVSDESLKVLADTIKKSRRIFIPLKNPAEI